MKQHWMGGKWCRQGEESIPVINPATEEVIDQVARGGAQEVDQAVGAARTAFKSWRWVPGIEKATLLHTVARNLRERSKKLAPLMTLEGGKPFCENRDEVERITAGTFWINDPLTDNEAGPFGGMRQTGHSRELGEEGLDEFRETKHVHLDYKQEIKPYWYPYSKYNQLISE